MRRLFSLLLVPSLAALATLASADHVSAPSSWSLAIVRSLKTVTSSALPFGPNSPSTTIVNLPGLVEDASFATNHGFASDSFDGTWSNETVTHIVGGHDVYVIKTTVVDLSAGFKKGLKAPYKGSLTKVKNTQYGYRVHQDGNALAGSVSGSATLKIQNSSGIVTTIKNLTWSGTVLGVKD